MHYSYAAYFGLVAMGGSSLVWIAPCTVNITSFISLSPHFIICYDVRSVNSCILFIF